MCFRICIQLKRRSKVKLTIVNVYFAFIINFKNVIILYKCDLFTVIMHTMLFYPILKLYYYIIGCMYVVVKSLYVPLSVTRV